GPHGTIAETYDLVLDGRTLTRAAWRRDDPALADRIVLSWRPGLLDRWVEVLNSSRHVVVTLDGVTLAESRQPVLLFETSLPTRYYFPEEDVNAEALEPGKARSFCPYKGKADRYWSVRAGAGGADIAWCYDHPLPAVGKIAGRVAF